MDPLTKSHQCIFPSLEDHRKCVWDSLTTVVPAELMVMIWCYVLPLGKGTVLVARLHLRNGEYIRFFEIKGYHMVHTVLHYTLRKRASSHRLIDGASRWVSSLLDGFSSPGHETLKAIVEVENPISESRVFPSGFHSYLDFEVFDPQKEYLHSRRIREE